MFSQENRVALLCRVRSALLAAVSLLCLGILLLSCSSEKECTYDTDCPGNKSCIGGKCVTHYPQDCPDRECAEGFFCIDDTCVESACIEVNCPEDEACAGGQCYPKDCELRSCPGLGEVCIDEDCLPADCMDIECPQGQRCAVGNCYPVDCETKNCPGYGEVCIDEECTQRTCVGVTCPEGQRCANGYCYPENCTEAGCFGEGEVCVDGVCRRISCLGVDCPEGYRCANGWCYPADCAGEDCSDFGEVCYEGKCVPADCAGVVCPAGQRCAHGECFPEKCEDLTCEADEVCYAGQCVNWNCVGINCPAEHNCVDGECLQVHCPEPCTMDNQCDTADCGGVEMTCLFDVGLGAPAWGAQGRACSDDDACTIDDTCDQGLCVGAGLVCDEPPDAVCATASTRQYWTSPGSCSNGVCSYTDHFEDCAFGCTNGSCNSDPCIGVTCNSPPADYCNGDNLMQYPSTGTCSGGDCTYTPTSVNCQYGCAGGACNGCTPNCTGKECGPDGCGGSCGNCGSGETCDGSGHCVEVCHDNDLDGYGDPGDSSCPNGAQTDCCDSDPDAFPGYFDSTNQCGTWDYDCNGTDDKKDNACQIFMNCSCSDPVTCYTNSSCSGVDDDHSYFLSKSDSGYYWQACGETTPFQAWYYVGYKWIVLLGSCEYYSPVYYCQQASRHCTCR